MYSIMHLIYGVPLTETVDAIINEFEQDETTDDWFETDEGECGFTTRYVGCGDTRAGWCGVELWSCDCTEPIKVPEVRASDAQMRQAQERCSTLHRRFKEALEREGVEVGHYFVFSTS